MLNLPVATSTLRFWEYCFVTGDGSHFTGGDEATSRQIRSTQRSANLVQEQEDLEMHEKGSIQRHPGSLESSLVLAADGRLDMPVVMMVSSMMEARV